jgi:hypothetical protein
MKRQDTHIANNALAHLLDWSGLIIAAGTLLFVLSLIVR